LSERKSLESLSIDWKVILKCIFKEWDGAWTALFGFRIGTGGQFL